jgi:hypothetical protein
MNEKGRLLLIVGAVLAAAFFAGSVLAGGHGPSSGSAPPTLTSPNGQFSIQVTNSGITLRGPATTVKVTGGAIDLNAPLIKLNGCRPVARVGDTTTGNQVTQTVSSGSPTVCAG